jgi:hypothetical protein
MSPVDWSKTCIACQYCCTYVSLQIDPPKTDTDYDVIRWYLAHRQIHIYIDDENDWYFLVNNVCENLTPEGCAIYEDRFDICRNYDAACCEMTLGATSEKVLFRTVEDFDRWLEYRRVRKETRRNGNGAGPGKRTLRGHLKPVRRSEKRAVAR